MDLTSPWLDMALAGAYSPELLLLDELGEGLCDDCEKDREIRSEPAEPQVHATRRRMGSLVLCRHCAVMRLRVRARVAAYAVSEDS